MQCDVMQWNVMYVCMYVCIMWFIGFCQLCDEQTSIATLSPEPLVDWVNLVVLLPLGFYWIFSTASNDTTYVHIISWYFMCIHIYIYTYVYIYLYLCIHKYIIYIYIYNSNFLQWVSKTRHEKKVDMGWIRPNDQWGIGPPPATTGLAWETTTFRHGEFKSLSWPQKTALGVIVHWK